jgi:hypothetical protein
VTTQVEKLRAQMETVLVPAKEAYQEVGQEIETKMEELVALRHDQAEIRKLIRAVEPEFEKRTYESSNGSKGKKVRSGADKYSPKRIEELAEWLRANAEEFNKGDGFYASQIVHFEGCPVSTQAGVSAILVALHEAGQVRLTRTAGRGGRKLYKVVI